MNRPKAILFDLFGTLLDMAPISREEIGVYVAHTRRDTWKPLTLPMSWHDLQPFPDVRDGLTLLAEDFDLYTLSNAPLDFQRDVLVAQHMFTDLISLAEIHTYKPRLAAYGHACDVVGLPPGDCLMVSGNAGYEQCQKIGMPLLEIRQPHGVGTLIEAAASFNS